ncbi:uncharacterized protein AFUA_7G01020 [Aspergillus fumigatus Af293]|uniref:Secreted protein n=2 Tax=Aspergillus fumigatus TaxID=746128 RepID=Q4WAE5_ASPFU|nr:hypothetical protein AFUA_7G01020 [Aspergillus fumigatus Af293]EAL84791.1 hypothetical protein AFUA_7G01020 [Aspergillus fumigatus Af293]EDP48049.1 hypothetical protein AFUB_087600 [Aspergillus fumigatus A1163]
MNSSTLMVLIVLWRPKCSLVPGASRMQLRGERGHAAQWSPLRQQCETDDWSASPIAESGPMQFAYCGVGRLSDELHFPRSPRLTRPVASPWGIPPHLELVQFSGAKYPSGNNPESLLPCVREHTS